jgi:TorA maturation chaperone TorD
MQTSSDAEPNPMELANAARARAAFYAFLSVHFTTLPDAAFVERMRSQEIASMLKSLANDESVAGEIAAGAIQMGAFLKQTQSEAADRLAEKLGVDRTRLYRGVTPQYGPPPPYEMVWSKTKPDVSLLTELAEIYRNKGLAIAPDAKERLDYIGVEMDYMGELSRKEASAWEAGDFDTASELLQAEHAFLSQHLGSWTPAFFEKAMGYAETDFYKGHLRMLGGFFANERQELAQLLKESGTEQAF